MSATEASRQQALIAALANRQLGVAVHEVGERARQGLAAYRANAVASAERALAAVFGTVQTMLGPEDFKQLAREFWKAEPPQRGDLAEWGATLPAWLDAHAGLADWPYLGDCARLDLARHDCERAADATLDAASLGWLASTDPAQLRLLLMPGAALLRSRWPIAAIHVAHRPQADPDAAFAAVRDALAERRADTVLVARRGWRAEVHRLGVAEACWVAQLLAGATLADALEQVGADFDFGAWLATALRESWLKGAAISRD